MDSTTCKILIAYHKPATIINDDILMPVHTGRAEYIHDYNKCVINAQEFEWMLKNTVGDDTGENISSKGRVFNETTVMYWAWKNYEALGSPTHIGFMHYRRHFIFSDICKFEKVYKNVSVEFESIDGEYLNSIGYSKERIINLCKSYDMITVKPINDGMSVYEHYIKHHFDESVDVALEIIKSKYSKIYEHAKDYFRGSDNYCCCMFIMKKELFFDFCKFLFEVSFITVNSIDYSNKSLVESRAFFIERLVGLYISFLISDEQVKYTQLPISFIRNTYPVVKTTDLIFSDTEKDVNVVFAFSGEDYVKYLSVSLYSIMDHSNCERKYNIYVLSDEFSSTSKQKIQDSIACFENCSVTFLNINHFSNFFCNLNLDCLNKDRFGLSTFYRLLIPEVFCNLDKILYLDVDITVLADVAELFDTKIENYYIGAARDVEVQRIAHRSNSNSEEFCRYCKEKLMISNVYDYFQAGVCLFNIKVLRKHNFTSRALNYLKQQSFRNNDQDILNMICFGQVYFLPLKWNVEWHCTFFDDNLMAVLPRNTYIEYFEARKNPSIVHYSSHWKPWNSPHNDLSHYFFIYARKTLFYENIIMDMFLQQTNKLNDSQCCLISNNKNNNQITKINDGKNMLVYHLKESAKIVLKSLKLLWIVDFVYNQANYLRRNC